MAITPYGNLAGTKKQQVAQMFDNIAPSYDLLNHSLSLGIDVLWRRKALQLLKPYPHNFVLDIATGTADFAADAVKILNPVQVIGLDLSPGMLDKGRAKLAKCGLSQRVQLQQGDAEALPFADNSVDCITVGFGVRNFERLEVGLKEMQRVLRPGGAAVVLEPALPTSFPLKQIFKLYFTRILPLLGRWVSGDAAAYRYLPASVSAFPHGPQFVQLCLQAGFTQARFVPLSLGICALYLLQKDKL